MSLAVSVLIIPRIIKNEIVINIELIMMEAIDCHIKIFVTIQPCWKKTPGIDR